MSSSNKFAQLLVITKSLIHRPIRFFYIKLYQLVITVKTFITFRLKPTFDRNNTFFKAHFTLLGLFAKNDGTINNQESTLVWDYITTTLNLDEQKQHKAMTIFFNAGSKGENFEEIATLISRMTRNNVELLSPIFEFLSELATADGHLCKQEELSLIKVMQIFNIERYEPKNYKDPYTVLGCSSTDSIDKIKRIYRRKIAEFHPDRMELLGLPQEFTEFGLIRFQEIQTAYEVIKAKKKIS